MALDDSMLSPTNIAVNPGAVAESFPWEVFEPVRESYELARFRHLRRQTKKANGQIKRAGAVRPPARPSSSSWPRKSSPGVMKTPLAPGAFPPTTSTRCWPSSSSLPCATASRTPRASGESLCATPPSPLFADSTPGMCQAPGRSGGSLSRHFYTQRRTPGIRVRFSSLFHPSG
jgi:hypothetical protein